MVLSWPPHVSFSKSPVYTFDLPICPWAVNFEYLTCEFWISDLIWNNISSVNHLNQNPLTDLLSFSSCDFVLPPHQCAAGWCGQMLFTNLYGAQYAPITWLNKWQMVTTRRSIPHEPTGPCHPSCDFSFSPLCPSVSLLALSDFGLNDLPVKGPDDQLQSCSH